MNWIRRKAGRRRILIVAIVCIVLWPIVAWVVARSLIVTAPLEHADSLVVLSSSANYLERSRWAAQLFREGRAPVIIVTNDGLRGGWSQLDQRNLYFFELIKRALEKEGVPSRSIIVLPGPVSSTYTEAMEVHHYAGEQKLTSLLLVTSPYHSRRALWTWRRVFADDPNAVGIETPPVNESVVKPSTWWLSASGWRNVGAEVVKIAWYRMVY